MNVRQILYYVTGPHSYNEELTHYYGTLSVENATGKWEHLMSSLKQKQIVGAIWVEQVTDMENGVFTTRVVKHEIRKLPKVLEINKIKQNGEVKKRNLASFNSAAVPMPSPASMLNPAESVQEFFNWGQPATIQSIMQSAATANPEGSF